MTRSPRKFVITGASGQLGRRVAERALRRCGPDQLILVTRRPDALADLAARGADVRSGDFDHPESMRAAFDDGARMLLISAIDLARRTLQHRAAIEAAVRAGVGHVIYTSVVSPEPPNPALIAPSHRATEHALAQSGLAWTVLRHSLYAEFQVGEAARAIDTGSLAHNRGAGRIAYVSRDDCAAVAAEVLASTGHHGAVYDVTGPALFDAVELATLYTELGGRRVDAVELDDAAFVAGLAGADADDHAQYGAELVASLGRAVREGFFAACSDTVRTLTGRPARTLREVLESGLGKAA